MDTRIFVSIVAETADKAIETISQIDDVRVGIEVRVDSFDPEARRNFDPGTIRSASTRPMLYTRRSGRDRPSAGLDEIAGAIETGFDLVDVEAGGATPLDELPGEPERYLLSLHDYEGVPDLDREIEEMSASGIPNLKIAVTPGTFGEDRSLLERLEQYDGHASLTLFGMGSNGLYSRTLAPFFGSRFSFVAVDEKRSAAPGQLTLDRGLELWSNLPNRSPRFLFAVAGSPVAHSQSPRIHNRVFRDAEVPAAYGMIDTSSVVPVLDSMERREPCSPDGLSVTAPLKEQLFSEGKSRGWDMSERARKAGSANMVVRREEGFSVDNTDLLGFSRALEARKKEARVAIVGAGGTARAAAIAARDLGLDVTIFNRTTSRAEDLARSTNAHAKSLDELGSETFEIVIDTLPASVTTTSLSSLVDGGFLVRAAYDDEDDVESRARELGNEVFGAIDLLEAQAEEQSRRFVEVAGGEK